MSLVLKQVKCSSAILYAMTASNLGQLFVTSEMIAKKIKTMKDNKSPGVDWIPPKLLKEIVEQISTPLAKCLVTRRRDSSFRMEISKYYAAI